MIVLFHVMIACASLVYSGYVCIAPTKAKIYGSYALIALTLGSGTYLVWSTHSRLMQACISGLVYLAVVVSSTVFAHSRLAVSKESA